MLRGAKGQFIAGFRFDEEPPLDLRMEQEMRTAIEVLAMTPADQALEKFSQIPMPTDNEVTEMAARTPDAIEQRDEDVKQEYLCLKKEEDKLATKKVDKILIKRGAQCSRKDRKLIRKCFCEVSGISIKEILKLYVDVHKNYISFQVPASDENVLLLGQLDPDGGVTFLELDFNQNTGFYEIESPLYDFMRWVQDLGHAYTRRTS